MSTRQWIYLGLAALGGVLFAYYVLPRLIIVKDAAPGQIVAGEKTI